MATIYIFCQVLILSKFMCIHSNIFTISVRPSSYLLESAPFLSVHFLTSIALCIKVHIKFKFVDLITIWLFSRMLFLHLRIATYCLNILLSTCVSHYILVTYETYSLFRYGEGLDRWQIWCTWWHTKVLINVLRLSNWMITKRDSMRTHVRICMHI